METILRLVIAFGALAHVVFFYKEAVKWDVDFVQRVAPSWIARIGGREEGIPYVTWAADLAINVGAYNLVLAGGLAWVAIRGADVAGILGIFFSHLAARRRGRGLLHRSQAGLLYPRRAWGRRADRRPHHADLIGRKPTESRSYRCQGQLPLLRRGGRQQRNDHASSPRFIPLCHPGHEVARCPATHRCGSRC